MDTRARTEIQKVPITVGLAICLVSIYSLYASNTLTNPPYGTDPLSLTYRNFVHLDFVHLMSSLFALYTISPVEVYLGSKRFLSLLTFLVVFTTIVDVILYSIMPNISRTTGLSSILFGILTWELTTYQRFNFEIGSAIFALIAQKTLNDPSSSLILFGTSAISGIIGGIIWKTLDKSSYKQFLHQKKLRDERTKKCKKHFDKYHPDIKLVYRTQQS